MDCVGSVEEYISKSDWRINANANTGYSSAGLVNNLAGKAIANYWLDKVYSKKEGDAHRNGDYHIHDLDCLQPYCCGHDLQTLLQEGFNGVTSRVSSKPPKHFREALGQMANFIGILQSEWAGAQAFSSFDTLLAPYLFHDMNVMGLTEEDAKKAILTFVYNLNVPSRWGQCVPTSYKCLRGDGMWVNSYQLEVGDEIYVVDLETGKLKKDVITKVNEYDAPEKMHKYTGANNFSFEVTPNHRVIAKTGFNKFEIKESSEYHSAGNPVYIPVSPWANGLNLDLNVVESLDNLTEEEIAEKKEMRRSLLALYTYIMSRCEIKETDGVKTIVYKGRSSCYETRCFEELCERFAIVFNREEWYENGKTWCRFELVTNDILNQAIEAIGDFEAVPDFIKTATVEDASVIIDNWCVLCGHHARDNKWYITVKNETQQKMLCYLSILIGKGAKFVTVNEKQRNPSNNKVETITVHKVVITNQTTTICDIEECSPSTQRVWCPTTDTGTFVCMNDNGQIFVTGNSPFSNVTIDMTVPNIMKELSPQRGSEPYFVRNYREFLESKSEISEERYNMLKNGWDKLIKAARERLNDYESDDEIILYSLTYKHFEPEMMIINEKYYEILSEGDSTGQPFTFPIPTVNITEDFDWDDPKYDFLWKNAALYGSSYFQNFIGSQYLRDENGKLTIRDENAYSPNDLRSMAFDPKQKFVYLDSDGKPHRHTIEKIYKKWKKNPDKKIKFLINGKYQPITEMFEIDYTEHNNEMVEITLDNLAKMTVSIDHKCAVVDGGEIKTELSQNIQVGELIPVAKTSLEDVVPDKGTKEEGKIVGQYLGYGSITEASDDDPDGSYVTFYSRQELLTPIDELHDYFVKKGVKCEIIKSLVSQFLRVYDNDTIKMIKKYVDRTTFKKHLKDTVYEMSNDFRMGVLEGFKNATYGNDYNVETETEVESINDLMSSLGLCFKWVENVDEDNPTYKYYTAHESEYASDDKYYFVPVVEVKTTNRRKISKVYNFTINTDEHLVQLSNGVVSHQCCRLQLSKKALRKRGGGLFGSDAQTGSIGVVTINMARLGYLFKGDLKGLYKRLGQLMDMARSTLDKKRAFVEEMYKRGLYPYTRRYVRTYDTYFSTIGVNGMNEMVRNFTNDEYDITDPRGQKFVGEVLDFMNERMTVYQENGKALWNLEATPAEGTTYRLAKADKERYGEKEIEVIMCDKHGEVEVISNGNEFVECPLCAKEAQK